MNRKSLKRFTFGLLVTVFILASSAVIMAAEEPFVDCGKVVFGALQEINTMDPAEAFVCYSCQVTRNAYEGLLQYNLKDFSLEPLLAESWEIDEDGGTFHLRKGVRFHDGTEFNAEAVRFNWKRVMAINKGPATWLKDITDVRAIDDHTVRIDTKKNWAFLLDALASERVFLMTSPTAVKKNATDDDPSATKWFHDHTCGTGPYMATEWVPNQYITMVRNDDYWKGWAGKHFSEALIKLATETSTRTMLIKKGDVDFLTDMVPEYWDVLDAHPNVTVMSFSSFSQYFVLMNNARGPLKDKNMLWAVTYGFGYEAFRKAIKAPETYGRQLIGPVPSHKMDLEKAMEYKKKSAYAGKQVKLVLTTPAGAIQHKRIGLILQDNLKKIGIDVEVITKVWPQIAKEIYGDVNTAGDMYPIWISSIIADPYGKLYKIFHSRSNQPGGSNLGYSNPKVDALLDEAVKTINREKRIALYEEVKKTVVEDAVFLYLPLKPNVLIYRSDIKAYPYTKLGDSMNQLVYFYDVYR